MTEKETEGLALLKHYAADADGRVILAGLAESIRVANAFQQTQWVPTARPSKGWTVNLRTGQIFALTLKRDEVQILLVPKILRDEEREALEEAARGKYEPEHPPGSVRYTLHRAAARKLWGSIERAHHAALQQARHTSGATNNPEADALIDYLSRELELDLPYPDRALVGPNGKVQDTPTVDDCLRILTRRRVPNGQIQLYQALWVAGSKGATTAELVSTMGRRDAEDFTGVLGALGNRINRTPGYGETRKPGIEMILRISKADKGRRYHLKPVMREALEAHAPSWLPGAATSRPPPPPAPPPAPSKPRFGDLVRSIAADGLLFPTETVANYILALQTKRFAILTGISGTGKTQIAMAAARSFRATVRDRRAADPEEAAVPEDAVKMTARPFHFNHKQLILPVAFVAEIDRFLTPKDNSNGGPITVSFPGGRAQLRFWQDPKPKRSGTWLLFGRAHDFRDWYFSNLQPGDHFYISPREGNRPGDHWLEFTLPETEESERALDNCTVVPVRPDWVDNRGLLGYLNPITGDYSVTPFLQLLLDAQAEVERAGEDGKPHPFFVVLDEMNLARVEHYFSDFLSALESGEPIPLHESEEVEAGGTESESGAVVPRQLRVPENVFFTGTVNVDETTYMFSPKVLDRAFTIEFDQVDLKGYTDGKAPQESGGLDLGTGSALALTPYCKPKSSDWRDFCKLDAGRYGKVLRQLHGVLEEEHRHFGYRVASEIARFVNLAHAQSAGDEATVRAAFDLALRQKVLPKFHGTQQELEPLLRRLFHFAVDGEDGGHGEADVSLKDWRVAHGRLKSTRRPKSAPDGGVPAGTPEASADDPATGGDGEIERSATTADADSAATEANANAGAGSESRDPEFPRTAAKVWRMLKRLEQRGFTSFIE